MSEATTDAQLAEDCPFCLSGSSAFLSQSGHIWHSVCVSLTGEPEFALFECSRFELTTKSLEEMLKHNLRCPMLGV